MINELLLWSGNNIPFPDIQTSIVQPKIKEISFLNENDFYATIRLLTFSKDKVNKDKLNLDNKSNFEIIMSILNKSENNQIKISLSILLGFMFPDYKINIADRILLVNMQDTKNPIKMIDDSNFEYFSNVIKEIFCLKELSNDQDFNPVNEAAKRIAEKIKRGRAVAARDKGQLIDQDVSIFKHYSKLLCTMGYTPEDINNLTIYQLYEIIDIYKKKMIYQDWYSAKLQGAKDLDDVEHWMNLSNN